MLRKTLRGFGIVPIFSIVPQSDSSASTASSPPMTYPPSRKRGLPVCAQYSPTGFSTLAKTLTHRLQEPAALKDFQEPFAEVGVKLVYIEAFPKLKLDGCSMLVEDKAG